MRGLLSSLLCSCWQNAMRPWHKPIFFAQLQRWGENWQGTAASGGREGIGKRAKRVNESKVTPGEGRRDSGQEGDTRRAFVCFVCSVVLVVVVAISNCQLSMNLQKYKQTDRQGQAKGRRVRSAVQLKRLTVRSARRSCPEIARLLACLPACLPCPALCQLGFWAGQQRLHVRVRATHAPGLAPSRIMQIKWHISMSVAILLLQFSSLPSETINWNGEGKGGRERGCVRLTDFGRCQLVDNPSKDMQTRTYTHTHADKLIPWWNLINFKHFEGYLCKCLWVSFKKFPEIKGNLYETTKNSPFHALETSGIVGNY